MCAILLRKRRLYATMCALITKISAYKAAAGQWIQYKTCKFTFYFRSQPQMHDWTENKGEGVTLQFSIGKNLRLNAQKAARNISNNVFD